MLTMHVDIYNYLPAEIIAMGFSTDRRSPTSDEANGTVTECTS